MSKFNKIYPAFYNGVSEQNDEMILDNYCKEMTNCIPDIVGGITKRPATTFISSHTEDFEGHLIHSYHRDENEAYTFILKDNNLIIRNVNNGNKKQTLVLTKKETDYLANGDIKGYTVQDRTYIYSRNAKVKLDYYNNKNKALDINYKNKITIYYKNYVDPYTPFVEYYLDATVNVNNVEASFNFGYSVNNTSADIGTQRRNAAIFGTSTFIDKFTMKSPNNYTDIVKYEGTGTVQIRLNGNTSFISSFNVRRKGLTDSNIVTIRGVVKSLDDLPPPVTSGSTDISEQISKAMYFEVTNEKISFFVRNIDGRWEETRDPTENRGMLTNMPIVIDRIKIDNNGISTFKVNDTEWTEPVVGSMDTNPDPSFVGNSIKDLLFYQNRLVIVSDFAISFSETAFYENFYVSSIMNTKDTATIDLLVNTRDNDTIKYVLEFNSILYIFTTSSQFTINFSNAFTYKTVNVTTVSNYLIKEDVRPIATNSSLYFISISKDKQQLREYYKTDVNNLRADELSITVPNYFKEKITNIISDSINNFILLTTEGSKVYFYNYKMDGRERVQSAFSTWELLKKDSHIKYKYTSLNRDVYILFSDTNTNKMVYNSLILDKDSNKIFSDELENGSLNYKSSILLPNYYIKVGKLRSKLNVPLIKRLTLVGEGQFKATLYRKDYKTTYNYSHEYSLKDFDITINSRSGVFDLTVEEDSDKDFNITSLIYEGYFKQNSQERT